MVAERPQFVEGVMVWLSMRNIQCIVVDMEERQNALEAYTLQQSRGEGSGQRRVRRPIVLDLRLLHQTYVDQYGQKLDHFIHSHWFPLTEG